MESKGEIAKVDSYNKEEYKRIDGSHNS